MDDGQSDPTMAIDESDDNIPTVLASLEMLSINSNLPSPVESKKILRKRKCKLVSTEMLNRRCSLKPMKKPAELSTEEEIREYYLYKNIKKNQNSLETIFEETNRGNEGDIYGYMGKRKYNRIIQFQQQPTTAKLKKRRAKIQKVFGSKINYKKRCITMTALLEKLNDIRLNSPSKLDIASKKK